MSERTSYLTAVEVKAAQVLHKRAPYVLTNVSCGHFSLARIFGAIKFQGCRYTYMPGHDECVRDDVLALVAKLRKLSAKKARADERPAEQAEMDFGGEK